MRTAAAMRGLLMSLLWLWLASAAYAQSNLNLTFTNCLDSSARNASTPLFTPSRVVGNLNTTARRLSFAIYGNVTGFISDTNEGNTLASALTNTVEVAGYIQGRVEQRLCNISYSDTGQFTGTRIKQCPVGPGPAHLEFETPLDFGYTFASISNTIRINGPTLTNYEAGCLRVTVTPPFPSYLDAILTFVPLAILILVGVKVVLVAVLNPWSGTLDPYRSFSNFGMDANALRMATPGFSDCLAYVQFAAYTSMLRLSYPGFFQLATSRFAWALLLFESSPITQALNYFPQRNADIASYINHVGAARQDAWRSFMIWFLVVEASVMGLVCILVFLWWLLTPSSTDLTMKNLPFFGGCLLRVYYWLLLPMTLFTSYQLVTAQQTSAGLVAGAALVLMIFIVLLPLGLLIMLPRHQPRQDLFEDISLLNLWGPLYNTFCEHAVWLWAPNMVLAIARGLVVGLLINYGIAQLVLLIIFEVVTLVLIFWTRPWPRSTNTTIVQLILIGFRIVVLFLMIPFVPSLDLEPGQREWVGYIVLIFHAIVMVFIILSNSLLTLLELAIRLLVIVPQDEGAKVIFGARQLRSRRRPNKTMPGAGKENSVATQQSYANLLETKEDSPFFRRPRHGARVGSGVPSLLMTSPADGQSMSGESGLFEPFSRDRPQMTSARASSYTRAMPEEVSLLSPTLASPSRPLMHSRPTSSTTHIVDMADKLDSYELTLAPTEDAERRGVDYAVREADIYHPQNSGELLGPSKKLGTGPADPAGVPLRRFNWTPWRRARNPEKGKFVVVRSAPAAQPRRVTHSAMQQREDGVGSMGLPQQPIREQRSGGSGSSGTSPGDRIQEDEAEFDFGGGVMRARTNSRITIKTHHNAQAGMTLPEADGTVPQAHDGTGTGFLTTDKQQTPQALLRILSDGSETDSSGDGHTTTTQQAAQIPALLVRPNLGERVESYRSLASHRSVPSVLVSSAVRNSDVSAGRSAQLSGLDLDS
jgi:hypothetical protein